MKGFASDNYSGAHSKIIEAVINANKNHEKAYGNDQYTEEAVGKFKQIFGDDIDVYFVFTGTGANVLSLKTVTQSYNAIICSEFAHINVDETGAPENLTGCKLLTIQTNDGKITVDGIKKYMYRIGDEHFAQPKIISISQPTELGTLYTVDEIKEISQYAKKNNLLLHVDGARISNAAVALNLNFKQFTKDVGVDILSFGGAKNGLMFGEAIIFFNTNLSANFKFFRKQSMQLSSKMRFISAQFTALLINDLWKQNAQQSNKMAQYLYNKIKDFKEIRITQKVETNGVFAVMPRELALKLQQKFPFYFWKEEIGEVRFMMSFDNTTQEIDEFVELIKGEF
jgi:threonine aldolase